MASHFAFLTLVALVSRTERKPPQDRHSPKRRARSPSRSRSWSRSRSRSPSPWHSHGRSGSRGRRPRSRSPRRYRRSRTRSRSRSPRRASRPQASAPSRRRSRSPAPRRSRTPPPRRSRTPRRTRSRSRSYTRRSSPRTSRRLSPRHTSPRRQQRSSSSERLAKKLIQSSGMCAPTASSLPARALPLPAVTSVCLCRTVCDAQYHPGGHDGVLGSCSHGGVGQEEEQLCLCHHQGRQYQQEANLSNWLWKNRPRKV